MCRCFLHNEDICKELVKSFLIKFSPVFITILQVLGNNRARQREKFGHILEEFSLLQEEVNFNHFIFIIKFSNFNYRLIILIEFCIHY